MNIVKLFKHFWAISTGFRHGVTTWLGAQLAVPLAQTAAWADSCAQNSCNVSLLPNWHSVLLTLGYASLAAIISALLKVWQQKRAFPSQ